MEKTEKKIKDIVTKYVKRNIEANKNQIAKQRAIFLFNSFNRNIEKHKEMTKTKLMEDNFRIMIEESDQKKQEMMKKIKRCHVFLKHIEEKLSSEQIQYKKLIKNRQEIKIKNNIVSYCL